MEFISSEDDNIRAPDAVKTMRLFDYDEDDNNKDESSILLGLMNNGFAYKDAKQIANIEMRQRNEKKKIEELKHKSHQKRLDKERKIREKELEKERKLQEERIEKEEKEKLRVENEKCISEKLEKQIEVKKQNLKNVVIRLARNPFYKDLYEHIQQFINSDSETLSLSDPLSTKLYDQQNTIFNKSELEKLSVYFLNGCDTLLSVNNSHI